MIRIDPNANPPQAGEALVAARPNPAAPDTSEDSADGRTWRWFTASGYPIAYAYWFRLGGHDDMGEFRAAISNENHTVGLDGLNVGSGNPALPKTDPAHDWSTGSLTFDQVAAEVEAYLTPYGWVFVDRA